MRCSDVYSLFGQIQSRSVNMPVSDADIQALLSGNYIQAVTKEGYDSLAKEVRASDQLNAAIADAKNRQIEQRIETEKDERKVHSIFFHFEGRETREQALQHTQQEEQELKQISDDLSARESSLADMIRKKSLFDKLTPGAGRYLSLTESGISAMNDLGIRLYRVSDMDFASYAQQMSQTLAELQGIADRCAAHYSYLSGALQTPDPSHRWSTSVGLAKIQGDQAALDSRFMAAYNGIEKISHNEENRLTAAEVLTCSDADLTNALPALFELDHDVRHRGGVPKESSAGVSSILFFGRRYDGTFPLDSFGEFRQLTPCYEAAALMSIVNSPIDDTRNQFNATKSLFRSWGYDVSDDTELSSAYLAVSGIPPEGFQTKLNIITGGLKNYLEYPLVASAILASIPVMEANETLNLLEKAYSIMAARATGLEQSEIIGLSVRMIHGIKNELVRDLDSTARIAETPVQFTYSLAHPFMPIFVPVIVAHSSYYSTFSGFGGAHPGHIHSMGGFYG